MCSVCVYKQTKKTRPRGEEEDKQFRVFAAKLLSRRRTALGWAKDYKFDVAASGASYGRGHWCQKILPKIICYVTYLALALGRTFYKKARKLG